MTLAADLVREIFNCSVKELLHVSRHDLDTELERQPTTFWEVSATLAEAARVRDMAKDDAESEDAALYNEYAAGEKLSDAKLKSLVAADVRHQKAWSAYYRCKERADALVGLLDALRAKQSSLKHLSELYQTDYYTTNKAGVERPSGEREYDNIRRQQAIARRPTPSKY
jgi:hypothetical protein